MTLYKITYRNWISASTAITAMKKFLASTPEDVLCACKKEEIVLALSQLSAVEALRKAKGHLEVHQIEKIGSCNIVENK